MPRYVKGGRKKTSYRADRANNTVARTGRWIDPYPFMHGTVPEKMVYAELSRRGIPFLFLNDLDFAIPEIELYKKYQADFVLPDHKLIIEVQGAYWHSKDAAIESDAFKFAIYQMGGYRVLAWWDYDILSNLQALFAAEPLLGSLTNLDAGTVSTELAVVKRTKVDTSKGIRTVNRRKALRKAYKKKAVRQRFKS